MSIQHIILYPDRTTEVLKFPAPVNMTSRYRYEYANCKKEDKPDYVIKSRVKFILWKKEYYKELREQLKKLGMPDNEFYSVMKHELKFSSRLGFILYHWYSNSDAKRLAIAVSDWYTYQNLLYA